MNFKQLNEVVINTIKHQLGSATSDTFKSLLNYIILELKDDSYHSLIKSYPVFGQILEAIETNGLEDWIKRCMTFMINKTMDEQHPVFFGIAQAVTKVLDKMKYEVISMCRIGQYNESFVNFLIVLMSISTLSVQWIITNLAGSTIWLVCKKKNENNRFFNIHRINSNVFAELITI